MTIAGLLALAAVAIAAAALARRAAVRARVAERRYRMLAIRDIAEEKALQHSLEEQGAFLSAVLEQLGERVTVSDAEGRTVRCTCGPSRRCWPASAPKRTCAIAS